MMTPAPATIYQFKVTLRDSRPAVWRRLRIASHTPLYALHEILQIAMGWMDTHMHEFQQGNKRYGMADEDFAPDVLDEFDYTVGQLLHREGDKLTYLYDFGDYWEHDIELEKITPMSSSAKLPSCTTGASACPPEDVGGIPGYAEVLKILRKPDHEEYDYTREWVGEDFDPKAFDKETVNRELDTVRIRTQLVELFADIAGELNELVGAGAFTDADAELIEQTFPVGSAVADHLPNYDSLHGYLTAVISAPQPIMPMEWLIQLCEEYRVEFSRREQAVKLLPALLRLHNQIANALADGLPMLPEPENLSRAPTGTTTMELWCDGYLRGFIMNEESWFDLEDDEAVEELEYGLALLSAIALRRVDDDTLFEKELHERMEIAQMAMPSVIHKLYDLARSDYYADPYDDDRNPFGWQREEPQQPAVSTKIGRNDPCPCGSGLKYKKCCINKVVQLH